MKKATLTSYNKPISLSDIRKSVQRIVQHFNPEKIILFGSYAEGKETLDSDVDLLIVLDSDKSSWELAMEISLLMKHSFPMDILVRKPEELAERVKKGDFFLKEILEKGKILYERSGERVG